MDAWGLVAWGGGGYGCLGADSLGGYRCLGADSLGSESLRVWMPGPGMPVHW